MRAPEGLVTDRYGLKVVLRLLKFDAVTLDRDQLGVFFFFFPLGRDERLAGLPRVHQPSDVPLASVSVVDPPMMAQCRSVLVVWQGLL